jgi:ATP-dependent DNA ligase
VWKHKDRPYRAGRSPNWVKVKNRAHPAFSRVMAPVSNNTQHKDPVRVGGRSRVFDSARLWPAWAVGS